MSQALTHERPSERPSIDMDDFERRLRQHETSAQQNDDPLAELARLVGEHNDPYGDVFAGEAQPQHVAHETYAASRREPSFGAPGQHPRLSGDFAAIEAGLRGPISAHPEASAPVASEHELFADQHHHASVDAYPQGHETTEWAAPPQPQVTRSAAGRGRRPIFAVAATIAVGVIGIGVAFAYKGTSSSPGAIKTIAAAAGPTKIQPPADASNDKAGQDSAMLGKKGADAPTQLVSREEQPVDVSQAVQENASREADTGGPGDASSVPVPPSPSQAAAGPDQMGFGAGMPAPKRVKVVSVRPDGSILPNDAPPAAALPAPGHAVAPTDQDPIAKASSPSSATPEKSTPRSASSKTSSPKTGASKKTTSRIASTKTKAPTDEADDAAAKPARTRVASAEQDDTTASLGKRSGGFAVQLAAPGSESDARSVSSRLAKKFSSALAGRHLGFRKAQANGKSVYRVRVGSLSKEAAVSLCEKLKSDGGSCFVAKNN